MAKRKVTQREGHPAQRFLGILPRKSVRCGRAFRQHIRVLAKRNRHPCRFPLRGLSTAPHRRTGAPGRAARVLRALFVEAGSRAKPEQEQSHSRSKAIAEAKPSSRQSPANSLRGSCAPSPACRGGLGRGCSLSEDQELHPHPASPCKQGEGQERSRSRKQKAAACFTLASSRSRAAAAHRVARRTRAALPGAPPHGLAGQGCPASAKWGLVFSWLLLFWTSKREVTRPPKEGESSAFKLSAAGSPAATPP